MVEAILAQDNVSIRQGQHHGCVLRVLTVLHRPDLQSYVPRVLKRRPVGDDGGYFVAMDYWTISCYRFNFFFHL